MAEAHRLLKPGGSLLITYPAMHDRFQHWGPSLKRLITRSGKPVHGSHDGTWDPDAHNSDESVANWISMTREARFSSEASRTTTMSPHFSFNVYHDSGSSGTWFTRSIPYSPACRASGASGRRWSVDLNGTPIARGSRNDRISSNDGSGIAPTELHERTLPERRGRVLKPICAECVF
jgi:hypothetical protein